MKIVAEQSWYITASGHRVPERHPLARALLVGKGCEIDKADLERYPIAESEGKAIQGPPETKEFKAPKRR
jgi:hypothetical protein